MPADQAPAPAVEEEQPDARIVESAGAHTGA